MISMAFASKENPLPPEKSIQLGRMTHQPWRKNIYFVSPSYRAKAFWGLSGLGCIIFLWSVLQAFLAADVTALDRLQKFSFNYSMVFTIFIGLLLAGLCVVICFQGVVLRVVESREGDVEGGGRLELRQSLKKPQVFPLSNYRFTRIISNESSLKRNSLRQKREARAITPPHTYSNALKNNSHTVVISFSGTTISFESQDFAGLEKLKNLLDGLDKHEQDL